VATTTVIIRQWYASGVAKKRRTSAARLDREITKALGKKGKLWSIPEKKPKLKPTEAERRAAAAAKTEKICRYCGQKLHWSGGHFECGGEGEGICSYWAAIGDYDRAGRPKDVGSWLDNWLHHEVGTTWAGIDWDRSKHIKAIRDYFKLGTAPTSAEVHAASEHAIMKTPPEITAADWSKLSVAAGREADLARRTGSASWASRWNTLARASSATRLTDNDWYWFARAAARQAREARRTGNDAAATEWDALAEKAEANA
jgi:hypothetical protein